MDLARITKAIELIEDNLAEAPTLDELAEAVGVSPSHLQRSFKKAAGVSPRQYAEARRLGKLKSLLRRQASVTTALIEAGYGSPSRLYEKSGPKMGMPPGAYRQGGRGVAVRFTIVPCPLGRMLLAVTPRGVCALYFGDSTASLEADLARELPAASRARDDAGLADWAARALKAFEGSPHPGLPLDVRATAFQWRVWEELRRIPRGEVRTYGEVAEALGQPQAARAVARACATNPVSLLIPCHRVVRGDGGLGGYRWGLGRKKALLDWEARSDGEDAGPNST
jgi:AraC family transcriptional regulator of adaptative response/methylated-DNA-[protein]-cysteine methyltransferase